MTAEWAIGVDIGGTFTDVVAHEVDTGRLHHLKVPTVTGDVARGVVDGLHALREEAGVDLGSVKLLLHGTTVATNAIIERRLARTALVTTAGFRDVLEIGRHWRAELYDPFYEPARPLVPRELRFEVPERLDANGDEVEPLDQRAAEEVAARLRGAGVEAVGVVFLHAFLDPKHERQMADLLVRDEGDWFVCASSDLSREVREYERTSTTVLNASLMPLIDDYLTRLENQLTDVGVDAPLFVTQSNGGALTPQAARQRPATLALSGPVAGVSSCVALGRATGHGELIGFDMGGTSTDVSIVSGYEARMENQISIGELPIRLPSVQVLSVGAGGGSVASVDAGGALHVGPESAGAVPGPACYRQGGTQPTVTDCQLVLGRLAADRPLGGRLAPDLDLARQAVEDHVGRKLGMTTEQAAAGVLEVANAAMERAVRVALRARGDDPRDFAMVAFGGAGPLHAAELARRLAVRTVLVPPSPGTLSALGLLTADIRLDFAASAIHRSDRSSLPDLVAAVFAELESSAHHELNADPRIDASDASFVRSCDVRYVGQAYEVNVPAPAGDLDAGDVAGVLDRFHDAHERAYGFSTRDELCELVTYRVSAIVPLQAPPRTSAPPAEERVPATRTVHLPDGAVAEVPVYERSQLEVDDEIAGPAVIHQTDTTTLVPDYAKVRVDEAGVLVMTIDPATPPATP